MRRLVSSFLILHHHTAPLGLRIYQTKTVTLKSKNDNIKIIIPDASHSSSIVYSSLFNTQNFEASQLHTDICLLELHLSKLLVNLASAAKFIRAPGRALAGETLTKCHINMLHFSNNQP